MNSVSFMKPFIIVGYSVIFAVKIKELHCKKIYLIYKIRILRALYFAEILEINNVNIT